MKALIIGATGATGSDLLELLLRDDEFTDVHIFVRRSMQMQHPKLTEHLIDFSAPAQWERLVKGDVLFSCLGTTLKAAGSKEAQWKIDHDYQLWFARAARSNGVPVYVLISSAGASPKSPLFYSKMKGQLEVAVRALNFRNLVLFNPPILVRKDSDRGGERSAIKIIHFLNKLGILKSQKPLPTEVLAKAMIKAAKETENGVTVYGAKEIWDKSKVKSQK